MEDLVKATILPRNFYARDAITVARELLGKVIVHGATAGRITETEAYLGAGDLAAHSARGLTKATSVIFGPPGHAYVYLIYGMHYCLNFVVETDGKAGCVLIRAIEQANGPGRLTKALAITKAHNGRDITFGDLTVRESPAPPFQIAVSKRIGITKSVELPLRFNIIYSTLPTI